MLQAEADVGRLIEGRAEPLGSGQAPNGGEGEPGNQPEDIEQALPARGGAFTNWGTEVTRLGRGT